MPEPLEFFLGRVAAMQPYPRPLRAKLARIDMGFGFELTLAFRLFTPNGRVVIRVPAPVEFRLEPNFTLLEGVPDLQLLASDNLLDPQRIRNLWCEEAMPDFDPSSLRLLRCDHGYVIADRFDVIESDISDDRRTLPPSSPFHPADETTPDGDSLL